MNNGDYKVNVFLFHQVWKRYRFHCLDYVDRSESIVPEYPNQSVIRKWNMLTDENYKHVEKVKLMIVMRILKEMAMLMKEVQDSVLLLPTVLHNIKGTSVSPVLVLKIAPGEGWIPFSFTTEPNWVALAFL